jgi:Short C-terminal domain
MTKQEVIAEYLNYALSETDDHAFYGITKPYFVRLVDGRVESYGRTGDFDSTKTPAVRLESDQNVKQDVQVRGSGDIYSELKKLKELKDSGVITEDEFQAQKKKLLETH